MNLDTARMPPPIAFTVAGKESVALTGGGIAVAAFGRPELESKPTAHMQYMFTLN